MQEFPSLKEFETYNLETNHFTGKRNAIFAKRAISDSRKRMVEGLCQEL